MNTRLVPQKILYIASADGGGVLKKIEGFCKSAVNAGYVAEKAISEGKKNRQIHRVMQTMVKTDAKYIVLRSPNRKGLLYLHYLLRAKFQGKVIILDQPSPAATYIKEVSFQNRPFFNKTAKIFFTYVSCPLLFLISDRVIQYGEESAYFQYFARHKTLLVGNGIDIKRLPLRVKEYPSADDRIALVGVAASISGWHGFDRVVCAMGEWKRRGKNPKVTFDIIGDNNTPDAEKIKQLIEEYGIDEDVTFCGYLSAEELNGLYSRESLAVASLGIYRKGLSTASPLKIREYCLAGIPFITAGSDPDFSNDVPFRFVVSNNDGFEDIIQVFSQFPISRNNFTDEEIRQYAIEHLSYDKKFKEIMNGL